MSTLTNNPLLYFFVCACLLPNAFKYTEKYLRGLFCVTRCQERLAVTALHRDLKPVKVPSKYLWAGLSINRRGVAPGHLRARQSPGHCR